MRYAATQFVGYANPRGIESSPGQLLVFFEAGTRDQALLFCEERGLRFGGPCADLEAARSSGAPAPKQQGDSAGQI